MLLKLFKYDIKKVMKYILIMMIVVGGVTILGVSCALISTMIIRTQVNNVDSISPYVEVFMTILSILGSFAIHLTSYVPTVCIIVFQILMFKYFCQDVLGARGYLTLTLPVTSGQILFSKLLSSAIGTTILAIAAGSCLLLTYSIEYIQILGTITAANILKMIVETIRSIVSALHPADVVVSSVIIPLLLIVVLFFSYVSFYFWMIFGNVVARKGKIGAGIGFYIGSVYLTEIVAYTLTFIIMLLTTFTTAAIKGAEQPLFLSLILLPTFLILTALTIVYWFVGVKLLKTKVDLQ